MLPSVDAMTNETALTVAENFRPVAHRLVSASGACATGNFLIARPESAHLCDEPFRQGAVESVSVQITNR